VAAKPAAAAASMMARATAELAVRLRWGFAGAFDMLREPRVASAADELGCTSTSLLFFF
jgi:hypothetical protein